MNEVCKIFKKSPEVYSLFFLAVLTSLAINAGDTTLAPYYIRVIIQILCYLLTIFLLYKIVKGTCRSRLFFVVLIPLLCYWLLGIFNDYSGSPQWAPLFLLEILAFASISDNIKKDAFNLYVWFLTVMSIAGLLVVCSFFIFPFLPYTVEPYYGENTHNFFYFNYTISYLFIDNQEGMRLCGLFNEPGYFGTMLSLAIISDNFNLKNPRVIIMLVAGLCTFSVAFLVTLVAYLIFRNCDRPLYLIVFAFAFFYFYEVLPTLHFNDRMLDTLVHRISFENGRLAGDNRDYINTTNLMAVFNGSSDVFFGRGLGATKALGVSFKMMIIQIGYIGVFLTYGLLFVAGFKYSKRNWMAISFLLCFFINVYQRTNIFSMNYLLVLFGGLLHIQKSIDDKHNIKIKKN